MGPGILGMGPGMLGKGPTENGTGDFGNITGILGMGPGIMGMEPGILGMGSRILGKGPMKPGILGMIVVCKVGWSRLKKNTQDRNKLNVYGKEKERKILNMQESEQGNMSENELDVVEIISPARLDEMHALQMQIEENENADEMISLSESEGEDQTKQGIITLLNEAFANGKHEFNSEWLNRNFGNVSTELMQDVVTVLQQDYDVEAQGSSSGNISRLILRKKLSRKRSLQEVCRNEDIEEDENMDIEEDDKAMHFISKLDLDLINADMKEEDVRQNVQ